MLHQAVEAQPSTLQFGPLTLGQTARQTLSLVSLNAADFIISDRKCKCPATGIEVLSDFAKDGNKGNEFRITQMAATLGSQRTIVNFAVQTVDHQKLKLTFPCTIIYHGPKDSGKQG
jgi:hypothetical protein